MSLVAELKRRNVFRVAAAYLVAGWLITEVLTAVLPALGAPAWTERAIVLVFALGFLPTLVFAWVFELTPAGLRRQRDVDSDETLHSIGGHRLEYATIAVVVVGVLILAVFGSRPAPEADPAAGIPAPRSVAVLPFENMSRDPDNEYFSDGLTETLLHMLAQIPDLKVAARTSSFAFKGENRPIAEIASALGVTHVLEGSVQRSGDEVRIVAQLIRADDGFHVWSASYDRRLDDIFRIQDEIATDVGRALSASLLGDNPADSAAGLNTESTDAFDLYLQALNERATFSYWGLQAEEDLLKGALAIDPDFVAAKTALAYNYLNQVKTGAMDETTASRLALALTGQVLEIRPHDADARAIRLYVVAAPQSRDISAERFNETLAELDSLVAEHPDNLEARFLYVHLLNNLRRFEQSQALLEAALERDPLNPQILFELGTIHLGLERWAEAKAVLERSLEIESRQPNVHALLATIALVDGDGPGVVGHLLNAMEVDPADHELAGALAQFLYELDLVEEGDDFRKRVRSLAPTSAIAYQLDMLRGLVTEDMDAVREAARQAIEDDVPNRRDAFTDAVINLIRAARESGTVRDALDWIADTHPGIFDLDAEALPLKYRAAQLAAMHGWYLTLPEDALLERLETAVAVARSFGYDITDTPKLHFSVLALRGDTQAAVTIALREILDKSALHYLGWERLLEHPVYAEIVADDRIRTRLERWREERSQTRAAVRDFLTEWRTAAT